jgi:membrane protease YdiL (CAAX protease family)
MIMFLVVIGDMVVKSIQIFLTTNDEAQIDSLIDELSSRALVSGTSSLIAIMFGVMFLIFYFRKDQLKEKLFYNQTKMTGKTFAMLLVVFMSVQVLFSGLSVLMEKGLNQVGYSILSEIESATSGSSTVSMFLYASLLGPITEELVFRGFVMRGLEKYGKHFAIIVSAVLFGAFHGNLIQGMFATAVGIVLAYVAMNYSIKWSILLHIINNFIFGDLWIYLTSGYSQNVQDILSYIMEGVFFVAALVVLFLKKKDIIEYIKSEKTQKGLYLSAFTSIWMIIFLVIQLLLGISGIEKL